jgi:hypothetical protein
MLQALFLTALFPAGGSAENRCLRFAGHKQLHVDPARPLPRPGSQGRARNVSFAEGAANKPLPARCVMGSCVLLAAGRAVAEPFRFPETRCETRGVHFVQGVTAQAGPPRPGAEKRFVFNDLSQGKTLCPGPRRPLATMSRRRHCENQVPEARCANEAACVGVQQPQCSACDEDCTGSDGSGNHAFSSRWF